MNAGPATTLSPAPMPAPVPAKKKNVLPIVLAIAGVLMVVSIASVIAARAVLNKLRDTIIDYGLADVPYIDDPEDFDEYGNATDHYLDEDIDDMIDDFYDQIGLNYTSYVFADVYDMDDSTFIRPNGLVSDKTVLWNGKTVGGLCDFIDENILQNGKKIDRNLLYDMISIHVVDPSIVPDDHTFEILMKYCLIVSNEFSDLGARMDSASFSKSIPNTYDYNVVIGDKASMWMIDYENFKITLNDGETQYMPVGENGMFSEQTMTLWTNVIEYYFGIQ